ncbi:ATP-dependent nuclease [Pseudomonas oryzihabitans]|uniref:ATP-dependent nuclease n=1 Tax=Pseudomonas oryzihabitans TaxID=47885 RepID=UPI000AD364A0|nr:ATP-binding protein [Pseudomonas oryzihabitans]
MQDSANPEDGIEMPETVPVFKRIRRTRHRRTAADQLADEVEVAPILDTSVVIPDTRSTRAKRWNPLESIAVKNFKAAKHAIIPLGKVTILVGPNGCGKSSVLQAVHWAARAASYILPKNTKEMISFERLDYIPSSDPLSMLHNGQLKPGATSTPVEVAFNHVTVGDDSVQTVVKLRAARNKAGITAHIDGGNAVTPYKQRYQFLTTYIPGLAGLSEKEAILAQPSLRRQAASGDAGGVLRNILLNLKARKAEEPDSSAGEKRLRQLNLLLQKVHPNVSIDVSYDDREDFHISATVQMDGYKRPLETAATGILQTIQIFAYLIFFEPRLMLIDEPDAHLHPNRQERLIEALEQAADEHDTQIILSTHSPHVVRAASSTTKLVWMSEGEVKTDDDEAIRRLLGWGGLDKSVLFFIEDEDDKPLRAILRQWPELSRQLSLCRCFGIENLPKDKLLAGLLVDGKIDVSAVIHRDGDFMTTQEASRWAAAFSTKGVYPWTTVGSDIEGYFCSADYLAALYGISLVEAERWRVDASKAVSKAKDTFSSKRQVINRLIWPDGGSPETGDLWTQQAGPSPTTVKGKKLLAQIKVVATKSGHSDSPLNTFTIPNGFTVAPDLKIILEKAIAKI